MTTADEYEKHGDAIKARNKEKRDRRLGDALVFCGGRCIKCGEDEPDRLKFVHVNPGEKLFAIRSGLGKPPEELECELMKCELVCRSCLRQGFRPKDKDRPPSIHKNPGIWHYYAGCRCEECLGLQAERVWGLSGWRK